jgi:ABC-type enterochelin transport system ATPase subunit
MPYYLQNVSILNSQIEMKARQTAKFIIGLKQFPYLRGSIISNLDIMWKVSIQVKVSNT